MLGNSKRSLLVQMGRRLFDRRIHWEIFHNLFPHLGKESDEGYAFSSDEEMIGVTDELDVQQLLENVEKQIKKLPTAYGHCFRYIMHRDIHSRLQQYARLAKRNTPPETIDLRFVARRVC